MATLVTSGGGYDGSHGVRAVLEAGDAERGTSALLREAARAKEGDACSTI